MADLTVDQAPLKGIKAMSVVVEDIGSNSCGVNENQVKAGVLYTLSQSKILVSNENPTYLYLNVNLFSDCSTADISLQLKTKVVITQTVKFSYGAAIWYNGYLMTGGDMESRINSKVNELTQSFVVDWNAANP